MGDEWEDAERERLGTAVIGGSVEERSGDPYEKIRMKRRVHAYVNALGEAIAENKVLKRRLHRAQERLADLVAQNRELRATKMQ